MLKIERYESGQIAAKGPTDLHGRRVGQWEIFFEDGTLAAIRWFGPP